MGSGTVAAPPGPAANRVALLGHLGQQLMAPSRALGILGQHFLEE
jgi:hypothetical protein